MVSLRFSGLATVSLLISFFHYVHAQATDSPSAPTTSALITAPPPVLIGPSEVDYCTENLISWTGGLAPYHLTVTTSNVTIQKPQSWDLTVTGLDHRWFNDRIAPGDSVTITIVDQRDLNDTQSFVVATSNVTSCQLRSDPSEQNNHHGLPAGAIAGIVLGILALLAAVAIWLYRRRAIARRQAKMTAFPFEPRNVPNKRDIFNDNQSVMSGRSTRSAGSLWTGFNQKKASSSDEGIHVQVDTVQVTESPSPSPAAPMQSSIPMFNMKRTTKEWSGYGLPKTSTVQDSKKSSSGVVTSISEENGDLHKSYHKSG